ncbi:All-trans-retinol 13,14-reductase [Thiomonas sp. X19]|uniref:FAD-dependent oxidoreductase n=1 Tax=Thiomonas sp. X19 TaxID=1050370 RepID=UPI000B681EF6|nr:FAD-dependent oxidoreductase [Thiomonas sp. X19]SCC95375.1 All-trans-retinol 13,14-reductase [Thiomonas sp. X19]
MESSWDAIVIGSGIGGLTAAGLLARVAKMKVLVLEKHTERGGLTHTFRRDGASWDVGLHYVGHLQNGTFERKLFDFLSGGALSWNRMPEEFERFVYPGINFPVPSDPLRYEDRLVERFPGEAGAIRGYFRDMRSVARWSILGIQEQLMPGLLAFLLAQYRRFGAAKATQTTGDYLERHFRSPELKALLVSQWGDYGLPPRESAFAMHALVVGSYLQGGWFPEGGSGRIARTFEQGIEASAGSIRVGQEVTAILTRDGRAVGVKVIDRRGVEAAEVTYLAPVVISNVGAQNTYQRLLPTNGEIGRRTEKARAFIDSLAGGTSAVTLYVRLKAPISTLGIQGENYWINATLDHDDVLAQTTMTLAGDPRHIYLSFPSAKSGDGRFHTAEIIALLRPDAFDAWRSTIKGIRGRDYAELKECITQGLLRLADSAVPGFSALVQYCELSTPLTVEHYTSHPAGRFYGLPGTPARYQSAPLAVRAPIAGLYLSGSDVGSLGIVGAMMGGVAAASKVLGSAGFLHIMASVSRAKALAPDAARVPEKKRAQLVAKMALTPSIWRLEFELDAQIRFVPGQYARLRVARFEWRDYSIVAASGNRLTLLVSNRTHGDGSNFADAVQPCEATEIELPLGSYHLLRNAHHKVFVATGTGLAPFLPMFEQLAHAGELSAAELYFGCRSMAEDITKAFARLPQRTVTCVSRAQATAGEFQGRVTQALAGLEFISATTDFYVCGSAAMVAECRTILERAGASQILAESY